MNGYGPGKFKGILLKGTNFVFPDFTAFLIKFIFDIFPDRLFDDDLVMFAWTFNRYFIIADPRNFTNLAIKIPFFRRWVISYKHYLGTNFQFQGGWSGICMFRKFSLYFSIKCMFFVFDTVEFGNINTVCLAVMGAEGNAAFFVVRGKFGIASLVEFFKAGFVKVIVSD